MSSLNQFWCVAIQVNVDARLALKRSFRGKKHELDLPPSLLNEELDLLDGYACFACRALVAATAFSTSVSSTFKSTSASFLM